MKTADELKMNDTFKEEDMQKYYVEYTNAFTILKTSIAALNTSMKIMMEKCENFHEVKGEK